MAKTNKYTLIRTIETRVICEYWFFCVLFFILRVSLQVNVEHKSNKQSECHCSIIDSLGNGIIVGRHANIPSNIVVDQRAGAATLSSKRDCQICKQGGDKLRRKTHFFCATCSKPVFQQHPNISYACFSCVSQNPLESSYHIYS